MDLKQFKQIVMILSWDFQSLFVCKQSVQYLSSIILLDEIPFSISNTIEKQFNCTTQLFPELTSFKLVEGIFETQSTQRKYSSKNIIMNK